MNTFRAFMELDKLTEASCTRAECIAKLKAAGKYYNFDKYTDAQLYRMAQRIAQENKKEATIDIDFKDNPVQCDFCGHTLNGLSQCPVCDLGEEDLVEGIFDNNFGRSSWIDSKGVQVKLNNANNSNQSSSIVPTSSTATTVKNSAAISESAFAGLLDFIEEHMDEEARAKSADLEIINGELMIDWYAQEYVDDIDRMQELIIYWIVENVPQFVGKKCTIDVSDRNNHRPAVYETFVVKPTYPAYKVEGCSYRHHPWIGYFNSIKDAEEYAQYCHDAGSCDIDDIYVYELQGTTWVETRAYTLTEASIFDNIGQSNWVNSSGTSIKLNNQNINTLPVPNSTSSNTSSANIVTIVYDPNKHKLRAQADDGIHGIANVAFPNHLRTAAGQQYEVGGLIWNGKNYRVSGTIVPIKMVQNINGQIIKENYKMNFQNVFEELNKLYEELPADKAKKTADESVEESCKKALSEGADEDDIVVDEETTIEDDANVVDDEPEVRQLALKCKNCGAIVVKDESEVEIDDDGVANTKDECKFCEETKGNDIVGVVTPYEASDEEIEIVDDETDEELEDDVAVEEGLFDFGKKKREKEAAAKKAADDAKAKREAEKAAEAKREADRAAQYKRDEAEREKRDRELKRQYERDRYNSIKGDTPSNTGYRGINYSGGDYYSEDIDADGITEGYSVKYGRGSKETQFDSLEDAVQHINDGMKKKAEDSYILYNNGKEMIWLDWYQASRDGSNNDYTVSRQEDKKTIKFEPKVGLSIIGELDERYDDEVGSGWSRSTPYSTQKGVGVWSNSTSSSSKKEKEVDWYTKFKNQPKSKSEPINSWDEYDRYNR